MHSCPECGEACYCGGDIDDIDTGDEEAEENCTHRCAEDEEEDDEDRDLREEANADWIDPEDEEPWL